MGYLDFGEDDRREQRILSKASVWKRIYEGTFREEDISRYFNCCRSPRPVDPIKDVDWSGPITEDRRYKLLDDSMFNFFRKNFYSKN